MPLNNILKLEIESIFIYSKRNGPDEIHFNTTNLPLGIGTFPRSFKDKASFKISVAHGTGVDYFIQNFSSIRQLPVDIFDEEVGQIKKYPDGV